MDLGQNYTQFVDDIESGEFDNFLSKSKRQELKRKKDRIKELRRGGMRMRDAIIQASEEAMDRRRGDREENRIVGLSSIVESKPARLKMNRPINKKYKLKGKAIRVAENDVDEDVVVKDAIKVSRPMELEEGALETSVDTTPKEEGFVQKYKTLLMIGGGLAVAFVLFKKFGKK
tara:strand:- start:21548 stop:22069 length:522 start_codon:yes stop_codon:yes gene_type:complete